MTLMPTVYAYQGVVYLRLSELPVQERAALRAWLFGQTTPSILGLPPDDLVYARDYEWWQQEQRSGEASDWDERRACSLDGDERPVSTRPRR